jgi:prepilin-type N-terminal cleavage/methylation domain-containing protein
MRKGFTLVEVLVASIVILVVLSALFVALLSFVRAGRTLELSEGALTLARVEIARLERLEETPSPGIDTYTDTLWDNAYTIETIIDSDGEDAVDVFVAVSSGDSVSIELTRRFYTE